MSESEILNELNRLETEKQNKSSLHIDSASSLEIAQIINTEDKKCALAVEKCLPEISKAIDLITEKIQSGGRLFYIGAGTSGRLGILDASECPPTFGTDPGLIQGVIAGGYDTLVMSKEGIEDEAEQGWSDLLEHSVSSKDIVCGIMASGRTPYVIRAIECSKKNNISTILLSCNSHVKINADINILPVAGPEVITGSTRMKSGTMQKMVLNMLSTGSMIKLGKVYKNTMIDLKMTSKKLEERAKKMIMEFCDLSYDNAEDLLESANGHVKSAIAMHFTKKDYNQIQIKLSEHNGFLHPLLKGL
jgi:N-acetylmuramic acid 6-phosphate etherase